MSNDQFHRKIEQLKLTADCWANNKELSIKLLEDNACELKEIDDIPCFENYIIEEEVDVANDKECTDDHDAIYLVLMSFLLIYQMLMKQLSKKIYLSMHSVTPKS